MRGYIDGTKYKTGSEAALWDMGAVKLSNFNI